jgi:hypothetical protein
VAKKQYAIERFTGLGVLVRSAERKCSFPENQNIARIIDQVVQLKGQIVLMAV